MSGQTDNKAMLKAFELAQLLRGTGEKEFPSQLQCTFFYICAHEGCLQEEVQKATCQTSSSVSRNVTWLGPRHRTGKDGLQFIKRERDLNDYKKYRLYLTTKGKLFKQTMENILNS